MSIFRCDKCGCIENSAISAYWCRPTKESPALCSECDSEIGKWHGKFPNRFVFDGVECASAEGLLQSFKFKNPDMQKYICTLVGMEAKHSGWKKSWWRHQVLYWQGKEYARQSEEYQKLLDRAYEALSLNEGFRKALMATGDAVLKHSVGKSNPKETVLTQSEFCGRLMRLRDRMRVGEL